MQDVANRLRPGEAPRIRILPSEVVNQIAAGEVVERPASVVKELVENSLDAGARRVDVAIEQGGLARIRVVDNGSGMTPADAELALERHATSKLRRTEDLVGVLTMGFRGEALPSIASVSRLTLETRPAGASAGWALRVEGGAVRERSPSGCREGTRIEVEALFYNTPARRKFMKSVATEAAHVAETVQRLALAAPGVHFTLEVDGHPRLDLPPCAGHLERARAVLGRRGAALVEARLAEEGIAIEACLAPPAQAGRTASLVTLIANGRGVRERTLLHGVLAGYGELLPAGRYPLAVVHLRLDPRTIDVNVHPQKTEIRLASPGRVHAALRRCVGAGVAAFASARAAPPAAEPAAAASRRYALREDGYEDNKHRILEATRRFWSAQGGSLLGEAVAAYRSRAAPPPRARYSELRVIGQALGGYLICEGSSELVLVDLVAARERIAFVELRAALDRGALAAQRLLVPAALALAPELEAVARAAAGTLHELGIELEPFGGASFAIRTIPALLQGADPAALVRGLLEELARLGRPGPVPETSREELVAWLAAHGPLPLDHELDGEELRALLLALDRASDALGPLRVAVRLERAELERRLGE